MSTARNAIMDCNDAMSLFAKAFCEKSSPFFGELETFTHDWEQDGIRWRHRVGDWVVVLCWDETANGWWATAEVARGEVMYNWTLECTVRLGRKKFNGALIIPGLQLAQAIALNSFEYLLDDIIDMRNRRRGGGPRVREGTLILAGAEWWFDDGTM